MRKQMSTRTPSRPDFVTPSPMCRPIGDMAISAPRLNSPIPITRKTEQIMKTIRSSQVSGASGVKEITSTSAITGMTDINASHSFENKAFLTKSLRLHIPKLVCFLFLYFTTDAAFFQAYEEERCEKH